MCSTAAHLGDSRDKIPSPESTSRSLSGCGWSPSFPGDFSSRFHLTYKRACEAEIETAPLVADVWVTWQDLLYLAGEGMALSLGSVQATVLALVPKEPGQSRAYKAAAIRW